uniref:Uncharacterized protein n=1 Tax=viral metagenome TaxID=1070528 RepID=A0A6M3JHX7_9ZZZZ
MRTYEATYIIRYTVRAKNEDTAMEKAIEELAEQTMGYNLDTDNLKIEEVK